MELDRARIIDENFIRSVQNRAFPLPKSTTTPEQAGLDRARFLDIVDSMFLSRHIDLMARVLREQQKGFYTIGSGGHEANAAIAEAFRLNDMAFLHYRSAAFLLQRAKLVPSIDAVYDQMLSLMASSQDPISGGRHKVLGSLPLFIPPQTSTIASHLPKALGTALSITMAKTLKDEFADAKLPYDSVVLCSFGDASVNHSTAQGAFNAASWIFSHQLPLPLVWICEDNGFGISVPTPRDWIEKSMGDRFALDYIACDGTNIADVYLKASQAEHIARKNHRPVFLHFKTVRLLGHAGSDIEFHYREAAAIERTEADDPLIHTARIMLEQLGCTPTEIIDLYEKARERVKLASERAAVQPKLSSAAMIMRSIVPPPSNKRIPPSKIKLAPTLRNMAQSINYALREALTNYSGVMVFGEDVGKKGGVYRVTADLQAEFGPARVFDTLLDEQTILGTAIGLAHNGFLPIPEIQFLAYTHNAVDQIRGEASTLSFFSKGQFTNPMVIRIPGLGYQKGFGGHFHNDNAIAFLREIPGIIIACPSNAKEAALLLREAIRLAYCENRVVIFLEPIALYMVKDAYTPNTTEAIALGELGIENSDAEQVIISYGNGMHLARLAAEKLKVQHQLVVKLIDLRWLLPLPFTALARELKNKKNILIVDECRQTGSISEQLITWMYETLSPLPSIKRICAKDSFIPLGDAWQYILPSEEEIIALILRTL